MFVYLIVNHATGKYYVGQHKGNDLQHYLQQKFYEAEHRLKARSYLYASMRKHGRTAFTIHALLSEVQTRPELDAYERGFITFLKSQDPEYGYNICRGGEGFTGPHSEASKKKQRLAILGRKHSPEAIAKMRMVTKTPRQLSCLDQTGVKRSSETISKLKKRTDKQKAAWKNLLTTNHHSGHPEGFRHTDEAKKRMSEAKKEYYRLRGTL